MGIVLVTGGAGFIGSHLVDALVRSGEQVHVVDNLTSGKLDNVNVNASFVEMDFTTQAFKKLVCMIKPEVIFHPGAVPRVTYSVEHPVETNHHNIGGTLNVLEAARVAGTRRVIYSASSSAYGGAEVRPTPETTMVDPKSPYAVQKLAGEFYCRAYSNVYGLDTVILRYFNVFGPRQDKNSPYTGVIAVFAQQLLTGQKLTIDGDGTQSRDFTYVENIIQANLKAGSYPKPIRGEVFNVGCGSTISILAIAHAMNKIYCPDQPVADIEYCPPRVGDVRHSHADIQKICDTLGYQPSIPFDHGLKLTCEWYKEQYEKEQYEKEQRSN